VGELLVGELGWVGALLVAAGLAIRWVTNIVLREISKSRKSNEEQTERLISAKMQQIELLRETTKQHREDILTMREEFKAATAEFAQTREEFRESREEFRDATRAFKEALKHVGSGSRDLPEYKGDRL